MVQPNLQETQFESLKNVPSEHSIQLPLTGTNLSTGLHVIQ
jgi:hypothetical protein